MTSKFQTRPEKIFLCNSRWAIFCLHLHLKFYFKYRLFSNLSLLKIKKFRGANMPYLIISFPICLRKPTKPKRKCEKKSVYSFFHQLYIYGIK